MEHKGPKQYTEAELKRYREIEFFMWSRDIEVGKPLTEKQFASIRHFMGDIIDQAKAVPIQSVSIHFDKLGQAHSIDNNGMIKSVNGVPLIDSKGESK